MALRPQLWLDLPLSRVELCALTDRRQFWDVLKDIEACAPLNERQQWVISRQFSLINVNGSFRAVCGHFLDQISTLRFECPLSPVADARPG